MSANATMWIEKMIADAVEAERERARGIAKGFWIGYPFADVADADVVCGLCEAIAEAIAKPAQNP